MKNRALILAVLAVAFYGAGVALAVPIFLQPERKTLFTALALCAFAVAVILTFVMLHVSEKQKRKAAARETEKEFDRITCDDYFTELYDFIESYGVKALPIVLKVYYVLDELYNNVAESGFRGFFSNRRDCADELVPCCEQFGNAALTEICGTAVDLNGRYGISDGNELPEACLSALAAATGKFRALDKKIDLKNAIKAYFVKHRCETSPVPSEYRTDNGCTIPHFDYFDDDAVKNQFEINKDHSACSVCGKVSRYIYDGCNIGEASYVCPHCIKSGLAHLMFGVVFTEFEYIDEVSDESKIREIAYRTPSYLTYHEPVWLSCCDDMCVCLGTPEWDDIVARGMEVEVKNAIKETLDFKDSLEYARDEQDFSEENIMEDYIEKIKDGTYVLAVFKCRHCGKIRVALHYE